MLQCAHMTEQASKCRACTDTPVDGRVNWNSHPFILFQAPRPKTYRRHLSRTRYLFSFRFSTLPDAYTIITPVLICSRMHLSMATPANTATPTNSKYARWKSHQETLLVAVMTEQKWRPCKNLSCNKE